MLFTTNELKTQHDHAKSFYKKAHVLENKEEETKVLKSYETYVCIIKGNHAFIDGIYSITTLRHIKEFLTQNNFKATDKKQIVNTYLVDKTTFKNVINHLGL